MSFGRPPQDHEFSRASTPFIQCKQIRASSVQITGNSNLLSGSIETGLYTPEIDLDSNTDSDSFHFYPSFSSTMVSPAAEPGLRYKKYGSHVEVCGILTLSVVNSSVPCFIVFSLPFEPTQPFTDAHQITGIAGHNVNNDAVVVCDILSLENDSSAALFIFINDSNNGTGPYLVPIHFSYLI